MFKFRGVTVKEVTTLRIGKEEREEGLHYYGIRHSDTNFMEPATVEQEVIVNHLGTIVTEEPLDLGEDGYIELADKEAQLILDYI